MLTRLNLSNFKSWEDTGDIRLAPVTLFFGSNSSGKTSILQSLLLMRQTAESSDRKRVFEMGGDGTFVDLGTYRDLVFRHELDRSVGVELDWEAPEELVLRDPIMLAKKRNATLVESSDLGFSVRIDFSQKFPVSELSYSIESTVFGLRRRPKGDGYDLSSVGDFELVRAPGRPWPLPAPSRFYGFPDQARLYYQNAAFLAELELALEQQLAKIKYLGPLRSHPERQYIFSGGAPDDVGSEGQLAVSALIAAQQEGVKISRGFVHRRDGMRRRPRMPVEQVVAEWLVELGLIHSFRLTSVDDRQTLYRVDVKRTPESPGVLLTDVGFGVSQVLPVLVLLAYAAEGDTVVLEQPEIHLHPSVQSKLADIMLETAKARNVQLIVESHSEHLLMRLQRRIAEGKFGYEINVAPSDVALYFCSYAAGSSRIEELSVDLFGDIDNWPQDFFGDPMEDLLKKAEAAAKQAAKTSSRGRANGKQ